MGTVPIIPDLDTRGLALAELLRLVLPKKTFVLAGRDQLSRHVAWASYLNGTSGSWTGVSANECAVFDVAAGTLHPDAIDHLVAVGAAVLLTTGKPPSAIVNRAGAADFPLLYVSENVPARALQRTIIASIVNREAELEQRGIRIYRHLAELLAADKGIGAIIVALHDLTGRLALLESEAGALRFYAGPLPDGVASESLAFALAASPPAFSRSGTPHMVATAPPVVARSLPALGLQIYSAPVMVNESITHWVSVGASELDLTAVDGVAVGRAAAVCALEVAKQQAVAAAASRLRSDFVGDLLTGNFVTEEAVERRARSLGYRVAIPSVVLAWRLKHAGPDARKPEDRAIETIERLLEDEMAHLGVRHLVRATRDTVVGLFPLRDKNVEPARIWAQRVRARSPSRDRIGVGIGRAAERVRDFQRSYQEAEQALELVSGRWSGDDVVAYDDLGVYRLLVPIQHSRELQLFYDDTVGTLVEHERSRKARLVPTLRALLNQNGNLSRTAEVLGIHRNTLMQRLDRISAITGLNLADPDSRLALHLGLKIAALLDK